MAREHANIFLALAQSRQAQSNHVQTVEQIYAEAAVFDALLQVLVSRGNHTHIGFDGTVAAHAVEMAVAQYAQQTGLQLKRHIANFVQKQRAAIGLFKAATAHGLGAREGTTLMAK